MVHRERATAFLRDAASEVEAVARAWRRGEDVPTIFLERVRHGVRAGVPEARRRVATLRRARPSASPDELEASLARRMIQRCTAYGGISAVPALAEPIAVELPVVAAAIAAATAVATVAELVLTVRAQVEFALELLLMRGHDRPDHELVDLALPYAFGSVRDRAVVEALNAATAEFGREAAESILEAAARAAVRSTMRRLGSKAVARLVPVVGIAAGAGLSLAQARWYANRVRTAIPSALPRRRRKRRVARRA